jgi:DNA mismatch endonuclease (patch repair protein)
MAQWPKTTETQPTTFGRLSRSELMSRVRGKGNKTTELKLVNLLREAGLKGWRRHLPLPGRPDFAWPKLKVAVFVDGCFWHGHDCGRKLTPRSNVNEWRVKISKNRKRDQRISRRLRGNGWSVIRIWECQLSKNPNHGLSRIRRALNLQDNHRRKTQ